MAIAGRVAIVPKGDWSANATYKRLDAVTYNNTLYFAKKDVPAGTVTSNTEYWSKSIVGGAGAIATKEDAGNVKPADGLSIAEDGTLKVSIDGTTLTMDQVNNVIKLADTLKDKINGAFPAANLINNLTTTEAGFGLDARQGKALDDKITEINGSLNTVFYAIKETKDANNADPGIAHMPPNSNYDTSTNNPFPNFHTILLTIPFVEPGGGYAVQIGVSIASQYNGKLAVRGKDSGNWQDWNVIS
ncbi:MAG: pyocin knob domain-containing protein [Roseburia faecis]